MAVKAIALSPIYSPFQAIKKASRIGFAKQNPKSLSFLNEIIT